MKSGIALDTARTRAQVAVVAASLALAACATAPRLASPKVTVEAVRIERLAGVEAVFTIVVTVANPNDRDVAVDAIAADVRIEDVAVGTARLASPVRLPARGETSAALTARASVAETLRAAAGIAKRADVATGVLPPVRYAVSGVATVDGGTTIPFSRAGEIPWPR